MATIIPPEDKIPVEHVRKLNSEIPQGAEAIILDIYWSYENEHDATKFFLWRSYRPLMENMQKKLGFPTYVAIPGDPVGVYPHKIIGMIIMGGADIHPKFYDEETNGSKINPNSYHRYPYLIEIYRWARGKIPILGVCLGAEFIVIVEGGSLIQNLPNAPEHVKLFNKLYVEKDTWLHSAIGTEEIESWCNHHQGVDKTPPNFKICVRDAKGMPHGYENRDTKLILAYLSHPERPESTPANLTILYKFIEECQKQNT